MVKTEDRQVDWMVGNILHEAGLCFSEKMDDTARLDICCWIELGAG